MALCFALQGFAYAQPDVAARVVDYETPLCVENDPITASAFLKDEEARDWLKRGDWDKQALYFRRAAQLKDLQEVLTTYRSLLPLSAALASRMALDEEAPAGCRSLGFGTRPQALVEWGSRHVAGFDKALARKVVMDWEALSEAQRDWLSKNGHAARSWADRPYSSRRQELVKRAVALYDDLMTRNPRARGDLFRLSADGADISASLDDARRNRLNARIAQAAAALDAIADLEKRSKALKDPKFKEALEQAKSGATLEDSLVALGRIFDKLDPGDKRMKVSLAPSKEAEFSASDRQVLGPLLGRALLENIASAPTGERLNEFYRTHSLKLKFQDLPGQVGKFHSKTDSIIINESLIKSFLTGENRQVRDVMSDAGVLRALVMLLSASFVHEATHQEQEAFARENGVSRLHTQYHEMEAMSVEALFVLEQAQARPEYKRFLEANQEAYGVCALDLSLGQSLARDPRLFRRSMMIEQYPQTPSLEARAAHWVQRFEGSQAFFQGELDRRAKLGESERNALDDAGLATVPDIQAVAGEERAEVLSRLKGRTLLKAVEEAKQNRQTVIESYDRLRDRYVETIRAVDQGLAVYRAGGRPKKSKVPPPPFENQ